jgi:hypothetical protein
MSTTKQLFWQKHLNAWQASGQSQSDYCKTHKLKIATFTYWRGKQKTPTSKLIPVVTRTLGQVSLSLPGGVQLHLPAAQLIELLPMVLKAVRSASSC